MIARREWPTLEQAVVAAWEKIADGADGLSDEDLAEALRDVAQDIRLAEARRVRLVAAGARRGWPLRDIAAPLGVAHQTVANILKRLRSAG